MIIWLTMLSKYTTFVQYYSIFGQTHNIDNNVNIRIRGFTTQKQKIPVTKCYPLVRIEPGTSDSKSNTLLS